ncbi:hypothetical protein C8J56DRAFT_785440, partial [Mycena floridula]
QEIITVFCATRRQGRCAINLLLKDGTCAARAITRNPESAAAKALAAKGVEVFSRFE